VQTFSRKNLLDIVDIKGVDSVEEGTNQMAMNYANLQLRDENIPQLVGLIEEDSQEVIVGSPLTAVDNDAKKKVILIRENIAERLYGSAEDSIGKMVKVNGMPFYIKGVAGYLDPYAISFEAISNDVEIPKATYEQYFQQEQNTTELTVFLESGASPQEVTNELTEYLEKNGATNHL